MSEPPREPFLEFDRVSLGVAAPFVESPLDFLGLERESESSSILLLSEDCFFGDFFRLWTTIISSFPSSGSGSLIELRVELDLLARLPYVTGGFDAIAQVPSCL
jgi:hypothetical protein